MKDFLRNILGLLDNSNNFNIVRRPDLDSIPAEELNIRTVSEVSAYTVEQLFPDDYEGVLDQINIIEDDKFDLSKSLALVKLIQNHDIDAWNDSTAEISEDNLIFSPAEIMKMYVELSGQNLDATKLFFSNMRKNATNMKKRNIGQDTILMEDQAGYENGNWMSMGDLRDMTQDWNLPIALHRKGEAHYTLILKPPERDARGKWRVLVYDPMIQGETWDELPDNFSPDYTEKQLESFSLEESELDGLRAKNYQDSGLESNAIGIFLNPLARNLFLDGGYEYDVRGDEQIANEEGDIVKAKRMRLQFDSNNCGLACYMMAAIRAGLKNDASFVQGDGRAQIYRDTGVRILLRDEVLGKQEPPDFTTFIDDIADQIVIE